MDDVELLTKFARAVEETVASGGFCLTLTRTGDAIV